MSIRDLLKGTGVALVTPFKADKSIDFDSYQKLLDFVIEGGVNYVVTLGTTGETPTLSREEKIELIEATFSMVSARVPVVVGIGGNNTASVIKDIETFPIENAVAVLSASPYYNKPSQEGIYQHYKALAGATAKPLILYNVPGRTGSNISAETTIRLAHEFDNISGIKEASGNMNQCLQILRDKPQDFLVVSGDDIHTARLLNNALLQGYELLFAENNPAGVKAALAEMDIIQNHLRLPLVPLSEGLVKQLKEYLSSLK